MRCQPRSTFPGCGPFRPNFSNLAKPLNELTQANTPFEWTTAREGAFQELKGALVSLPVVRAPDFNRPFELHTDWAKTGLGVVLPQRDDDKIEYVIAYVSRSNNKAESNYLVMREKLWR